MHTRERKKKQNSPHVTLYTRSVLNKNKKKAKTKNDLLKLWCLIWEQFFWIVFHQRMLHFTCLNIKKITNKVAEDSDGKVLNIFKIYFFEIALFVVYKNKRLLLLLFLLHVDMEICNYNNKKLRFFL